MPLICETKPINIHQIVAYQRNGCVKTMNESRGPETVKGLQHHIPIQVEQEETPVENHTKKSNSKDHCTIEINELETNVWLLHSEVSHTQWPDTQSLPHSWKKDSLPCTGKRGFIATLLVLALGDQLWTSRQAHSLQETWASLGGRFHYWKIN